MTVLIEETVSEVAKWNPNRQVLGWHRKPNVFNVAFADGHAGPIRLSGQTGGTDPTGNYWLRRGEGWRMDCYPSAPVFDRPRRGP
jgi:prepilin-type processing-associated H-X9-DG protein